MKTYLLSVLLLGLLSFPANAQVYSIDYVGFGWETGGLWPSEAGDEFVFTAITDNLDPAFGVDLDLEELTFHVYGLISDGTTDLGGGYTLVNYSGGFLDIYLDTTPDAVWGINPPNPQSPDKFADGLLFFRGSFFDFAIFFGPDGSGSFEGNLDGISGDIINAYCSQCVYTWGGAFSTGVQAQIPTGYDIQIDGMFEIDSAVPSQRASWGSVKALFSR